MTPAAIKARLEELNPKALLCDDFDEALVGIGQQFNKYLAVYSLKRCAEVLCADGELSHDDALDYLGFNTLGAYVGEFTPIFLLDLDDPDPPATTSDGGPK